MKLTHKQKQLAILCLEGKDREEIAKALNLKHDKGANLGMVRLFKKFNVKNRYEFMSMFVTIPNKFDTPKYTGRALQLKNLGLTGRQIEVAIDLLDDQTPLYTADKLRISKITVYGHITLILKKLNIKNKKELKAIFNKKQAVKRVDDGLLPQGIQ